MIQSSQQAICMFCTKSDGLVFLQIILLQVEEAVLFVNFLYTIPIQITVTIYFVYTYISYAAFVGKWFVWI